MKKAACIVAVGIGLLSAKAHAQEDGYRGWGEDGLFDAAHHNRPVDLSLMAWIPWYYGLGIAGDVRVEVPIVPDGFIPTLNDEFDIEGSLAFGYVGGYYAGYGGYPILVPAVYALYAMHLTHVIRVYAGLGLGYDIGFCNGCGPYNYGWFYWDPVVGANFRLTPNFAFRAELGSQGVKGGVQFYF